MPKTSESLLKAINKYETDKIDRITIKVPKGQKAVIQNYAKSKGKSLNSFIVELINNEMNKD